MENHHHLRFRDTIVILQKGHIDPNKPTVQLRTIWDGDLPVSQHWVHSVCTGGKAQPVCRGLGRRSVRGPRRAGKQDRSVLHGPHQEGKARVPVEHVGKHELG